MGNVKWTEDDEQYLRESWGTVSISRIAQNLKRSVTGVKEKAKKLGLTRHIHSGEYLTFNQLLKEIGINESYTRTRLEKNGIPIKLKKSIKKKYKVIYIDEFWKWACKNKNMLNFKNFEPGALGWPEPSWVDIKRQSDKNKAKITRALPWTEQEDKQLIWLIDQYKYGYVDIARMMQRTEGAIKRRLYNLQVKGRPVKAENHRKWEQWETKLLIEMLNNGFTHEDISMQLNNRSVLSVRGKVERLQIEMRDKSEKST